MSNITTSQTPSSNEVTGDILVGLAVGLVAGFCLVGIFAAGVSIKIWLSLFKYIATQEYLGRHGSREELERAQKEEDIAI